MTTYETLPSGIKIVEYTPALAQSIAEMWNLSTEDWGGSNSVRTAAQVISQHATASYYNVYIAMDGETVVGYCSFGRYFGDANTLYIALLGVRPDYKNKKIGKALVLRCVQRTIELGYPRLDLFTWPGNTAAVPLYKKCGFMWEDRSDTTHLANFIPTIVTTPLFTEFFAKADWYADSTRSLEVTPDGEEVNKFELFTYSWEKDGESLAVGFERTGRQMRMIETTDYKIELMAEDHELAFGTNYNCSFSIENKTGKPLNIKIKGKEDKNIKFNYSKEVDVVGSITLPAKFYVGETDVVQDVWHIHPCLLADIEINGQAVTFGMGIEAKYPLNVHMYTGYTISQVGMTAEVHLNIESSLLEDAKITINIPENRLLAFSKNIFTVDIAAKGKATITTPVTILSTGFEAIKLSCSAVLPSGTKFDFTTPFDTIARDMTHAFSGETRYNYSMFNGPWRLDLIKQDGEATVSHLLNHGYWCYMGVPKLGKPYDDEFTIIKPTIKMYQQNTSMIMEAEFVSEKFPGMVVIQVYNLSATGFVTRHCKIENRSDRAQHVMLQDGHGIGLGGNTVYSYKGQITQNSDSPKSDVGIYGLSSINPDFFDENWVFEASETSPRGFCWPVEYKPSIQWGDNISFEINPGELAPGQCFETKPIVYALGLFTNFNDFRNYARQVYVLDCKIPTRSVDVVLNGYNPFATGSVKLDVVNNREQILAGTFLVSSESLPVSISQTNPLDELVERNTFNVPVNPSGDIEVITLDLNTVGYEKTYNRIILTPSGEVACVQNETVYSVSNGAITFKVDPQYGSICYSLTDAKGQEWLLSQYPEHKPYGWWNPFLGGISVTPPGMDSVTALKEKISANFAKIVDNFGNTWQGICSTLSINEYTPLKGIVYKTYYMTLPGLPVLCAFYQIENNSGAFRYDWVELEAYLNPDKDPKNVLVEGMGENRNEFRVRMGTVNAIQTHYTNMATITSSRQERMYLFHGNKNNTKNNSFWGDNKFPLCASFSMNAPILNGKVFASSPAFFVVTDKVLPQDALNDLERVKIS